MSNKLPDFQRINTIWLFNANFYRKFALYNISNHYDSNSIEEAQFWQGWMNNGHQAIPHKYENH